MSLMRGADIQKTSMLSYVRSEDRIPEKHPARAILQMANRALHEMSPMFATMYSLIGRPSIPPEQIMRALLLQILYTIRSERQLMEQMNYNLLFRWFVGLDVDDPVWDVTVFTKNRDRFLNGEVAKEFAVRIVAQAREANLLSEDHFTVDGTLIEAWASHKSFQPKKNDKDGDPPQVSDLGEGGKNPSVDFHGEQRSNATHASVTDPDARLARKNAGSAAILAHCGNALMENRNGLVIDTLVLPATGTAEYEAAAHMIGKIALARAREVDGRTVFAETITLGADKKYDTADMVAILEAFEIAPHIARNVKRKGGSAVDEALAQSDDFAISQRKRKLVEEIFGWCKVVGTARKTKMRGTALVGWMFTLNGAVYNLVRMVKLLAAQRVATPLAA